MPKTVKPVNSVSIIGCGDIGYRVANLLIQHRIVAAEAITGFSRNVKQLSRLSALNTDTKKLELDNLATCGDLFTSHFGDQLVFYFAPPPASGSRDSRLRNWLGSLDKQQLPRRILYISTTGVYGDQQGQAVNETATTQPGADRARRRLDAEQALADFAHEHNIDYVILRVAGIYGAQRLPRKRLEQQLPILRLELAPLTNHVHEDDLCNICIQAALHSDSGEIYNVADDDQMTMSEYFIFIAEKLQIPAPPQIDWQQAEQALSKSMLSYLKESRIIDNSKIKNKLGITLRYPTLSDFFKLYC